MSTLEFKLTLAVVIGINNYQNGIPALGTARQDAEAIAKILERDYHYQVHLITDSEATSDNIMRWLETDLPEAMKTANPSRFLFYFAGHGIALNGDDGPEGYLIPQNARLGDVSTYLPMSQVYKSLIQLSCRHFLGILDCCFAGAFRWSSTRKLVPVELGTIHKERFDRFIQDPAWQVITSAAHDQTASDSFNLKDDRGQKGGHSPFAAALMGALQGKADAYPAAELDKPAGDGVMTATELYLYLRDHVEVSTEACSLRQTPGIYPLQKHDKGEYIFLTPGHPLNLPPAPPLDVSSNPYRGLESFDEAHKDLFFGRKVLTQQLAEFVITHSLTVVLSASGAGKSSLVKAGLIPILRQRQDWHLLPPFRPGESPLKALDQAIESLDLSALDTSATDGLIALDTHAASSDLPAFVQRLAHWFKIHPQAHLLVVVDQFEEIITLCRDEQEGQQSLNALAEMIASYPTQLHLVLTLRSDFEPQFRNMALEKYWQAARFVVPAMTREELRQVIEEPASARVMYFAPHELVDQLIDEVANMPGALPLLSFALSELYLNYLKRQEGARNQGETIDRAITQSDYEELGGVTRSLTQRAEREYDALVQEDSAYAYTVRNVMLRMVSVSGELARRRVPLSELAYPVPENGRVQTIVKRFESARLLTTGTDTEDFPYVEPAHDALVRGWQRLLRWKQLDLASLVLQRELYPRAERWKKEQNNKQSIGLLWNADPRLPQLRQLLNADYSWLNQTEVEFIRWSSQRRINNQRRLFSSIITVMLILSGLTVFAFVQQTHAKKQRNIAIKNQKSAQLEQGSVVALRVFERDQIGGLFDALRVGRSLQSNFADFSLATYPTGSPLVALQSILGNIQEKNHINIHQGGAWSASFSPGGQLFATAGADGTIRVWKLNGALLNEFSAHQSENTASGVKDIEFTPDGQQLVTVGEDGALRVWNVEGQLKWEKMDYGAGIASLSINPTGKQVAITGANGTWLVDLASGQRKFLQNPALDLHSNDVSFSTTGHSFATAGDDGVTRLWNLSGQLIKAFAGHDGAVFSIAFSPDGRKIATAGRDRTAKLWDIAYEQTPIATLSGHERDIFNISFSPDGRQIATSSWDGTARLWSISGQQLTVLKGHQAWIGSARFSPDGKQLLTTGFDDTARIWDLNPSQFQEVELVGHQAGYIKGISYSPDGKLIATSGDTDGTVRLWDQSGKQVNQLQVFPAFTDRRVLDVSYSPNGQQVAIASQDGVIRIWNISTGQVKEFQGHNDWINAISFSPDGRFVLTASNDGTAVMWDLSGHKIQGLGKHQSWINDAVFSEDGQLIATASDDGIVRIWNLSGRMVREFIDNKKGVHQISFSPDGSRIATAGADRIARIRNVSGELIQELRGHQLRVYAVTFSPDGEQIATAGAEGTVKLWNLPGQQLAEFPATRGSGSAMSVRFSPDGKQLATGGEDGVGRLWRLENLDELLARGCRWLNDYLTYNPDIEEDDRQLCNTAVKQ
jgi:WD40 repeat protein